MGHLFQTRFSPVFPTAENHVNKPHVRFSLAKRTMHFLSSASPGYPVGGGSFLPSPPCPPFPGTGTWKEQSWMQMLLGGSRIMCFYIFLFAQ